MLTTIENSTLGGIRPYLQNHNFLGERFKKSLHNFFKLKQENYKISRMHNLFHVLHIIFMTCDKSTYGV